MSWQVGAFGILGLALAAGFAWYERSRPDARIVALVGTLAAFAALGRIAFAAVPNVKPTTDIVLIAGFALGSGPGFAVGAIAGLTSNFFFGQGPWTPWQMAAWGATGLIGAGVAWLMSARPGGRRPPSIGRWPLALVCGGAGFAFTAIQDVGDWVTFSDHSRAQLGAYVGQGLGFDAVHAAGCLGFALVFGPALIRSIQRFARRLEVTWLDPAPLAAVLAAVILGAAAAGLAAAPRARAGTSPATYLLHAQNADGGFGEAAGQPSGELYAGWAALGLASAGYRLDGVTRDGHSVLDYVREGAGTADPGSIERTILVACAAGQSARAFGGHDLIAALQRRIGRDGAVSDQVNLTTFAILALRGARLAAPAPSMAWLERQQDRDGGFSFAGAGASSDVDDTGATLEALAGEGGRAVTIRRRAVAYLRREQAADGGFPSQPGTGSNAQSTAWAIQGLDAAGVDPAGLHRAGARSPLDYLRSLIGPDGQIAYARGTEQTPVWVTGEALMALEGKPLPLAPPPPAAAAGQAPAPAPGAGAAGAAGAPAASRAAGASAAVQHAPHTGFTPPAAAGGAAGDRRRRGSHRPPPGTRLTGRPHLRDRSPALSNTGMQSATFDEVIGVATSLLLAPVGAG